MNKIIEKIVEPNKIEVGSTFLLKVKVDDSIETGEVQGTIIYINDSANSRIARLKILGNSVQNGTPTTANPVLIKNAGDTKNLYYLPETGTSNGITYSINEDGTINLSGTATAAVTFPIFKSIAEAQIENGTTYTFSSNQALPSGVDFRAEAFNNSSWLRHLIGSVLDSSHQVFTGTANLTNATRIRHLIYIANGTTVNITNLGIQFEKGNTQSSFTPEGKGFIKETISNSDNTQSQNFTIPCQQPMKSIVNVRDEFVKENRVWYERHNIGVIESYNGETITTDFMSSTGQLSTGAFVQYVLDTPTNLECTQEQIQVLESLAQSRTYEPITNIYSTDETPAYLDLIYYKKEE